MAFNKITTSTILEMKGKREKITMLTAYDYMMAGQLDECGIDMILVGDSVGNVVLGYENTIPVTMDEMKSARDRRYALYVLPGQRGRGC